MRRANHSYRGVLPIIRTEESYRVCARACVCVCVCVCVCICVCTSEYDCQASIMRTPWPKGDVAPLEKIANDD